MLIFGLAPANRRHHHHRLTSSSHLYLKTQSKHLLCAYMLRSTRSLRTMQNRIQQMASHITTTAQPGVTLAAIPKTSTFTSKLPPDPAVETPAASYKVPRDALGSSRMVREAMYTYVSPMPTKEPELLSVSPKAMADIGLQAGEAQTDDFRSLVAGNKIFWSEKEGGVYPWAQCYGGMLMISNTA